MNEFYRVLAPGGILLAVTPCYPSPAAFMDPTHVNIITPGTHRYFADDNWARSLSYGFVGEFKTLSAGWFPWASSWILHSTLDSPHTNQGNQEDSGKVKIRSPLPKRINWLTDFILFIFFKRARTHYLWVLEKVPSS